MCQMVNANTWIRIHGNMQMCRYACMHMCMEGGREGMDAKTACYHCVSLMRPSHQKWQWTISVNCHIYIRIHYESVWCCVDLQSFVFLMFPMVFVLQTWLTHLYLKYDCVRLLLCTLRFLDLPLHTISIIRLMTMSLLISLCMFTIFVRRIRFWLFHTSRTAWPINTSPHP